MRGVGLGADTFRRDRGREAGPPGAGIELGIGLEQWIPAAYAAIGSIFMMIPILSGEGWFRAFPARNLILLGG